MPLPVAKAIGRMVEVLKMAKSSSEEFSKVEYIRLGRFQRLQTRSSNRSRQGHNRRRVYSSTVVRRSTPKFYIDRRSTKQAVSPARCTSFRLQSKSRLGNMAASASAFSTSTEKNGVLLSSV